MPKQRISPGDRFKSWAYTQSREISPLVAFPNRCGVYAIELHEAIAEQQMTVKPTSPELLAYLFGIGEAYR